MTNSNTDIFAVYLFTKVPYVTRLLEIALIIIFIFLALITWPLMYADNSPAEIQVLYFMTLYPETLRRIIWFSTILFILILPFYIGLKRKRNASLILHPDKLEVTGKGYKKLFPIEAIRVIYCFDPQTRAGFPKEKLTIAIYTSYDKPTRVQLKDYTESDRIMDLLMKYENLKIEMFSDTYLSVTDEE
jgi:hypothetical protein